MFNTIIKYTRIPDGDDLSMNESEFTLLCNNPCINYTRSENLLIIEGSDVYLQIRAKNIHIEEMA